MESESRKHRMPPGVDGVEDCPPKPQKLSEELKCLIAQFGSKPVTLRELIMALKRRTYVLLMFFLSLPFMLPMPLPGLSIPFGVVIALISVRLMLGQKPWLPAKLLDLRVPPSFFSSMLRCASWILRGFETLLKPRQLWLTTPSLSRLHACPIFLAACVLLLPLPPGTNFPPALVIVLMAGGLLERDGFCIVAGYIVFFINVAVIALLAFFGTRLFDAAWHGLAA